MNRCLYNNTFNNFIKADSKTILGELCENYHGDTYYYAGGVGCRDIHHEKRLILFTENERGNYF